MRIIQKILFIAIFGWCVGNAKGMAGPALPAAAPVVGANILDFNTIFNLGLPIPASFRPKIYHPAGYAAAGPNNLKYVYFAIPHNGIIAPANFLRPVNNTAPLNADYNIYFPADGHQPTTPEAVEYSCANVDNREDSPITDWYMQMFGVIPFQNAGAPGQNDYVKAGWSPPAPGGGAINAQRIISFFGSVDNTMVNDPNIPGAQIGKRDLFEREFRKIASTSVGRVLLYRILIEIRRHNPGENVGCTENDQYFTDTTTARRACDRCRKISIMCVPTFGFDDTIAAIFFYENPNNIGNTTPLIFSVIGKSENDYTHIVQSPTRLDVVIFHEISHWFHHLRNPKRYYDEINANNKKDFCTHLPKHQYVHQYYWNGIDRTGSNPKYANIWFAGNSGHLDFEEMRNMLGMPYDSQNILQGDDLCENLYRINQGLPLRFGYSGVTFYEDKKVTDRVIDACIRNHLIYITGKNNTVDFAYKDGVAGFGSSKVPR